MKQTERIDAFKAMLPEGELENVYLHPEKPKYLYAGADNILSVFSTSQHVNESVAFLKLAEKQPRELRSLHVWDQGCELQAEGRGYRL